MEVAKTAPSFYLFWLDTILGDMALFVAVITGNLAKIFPFGIGREFGIIFSSWSTTFLVFLFVAPPLVRLLLLFFPYLFRGFSASELCLAWLALLCRPWGVVPDFWALSG